jgi:hypothetical protein
MSWLSAPAARLRRRPRARAWAASAGLVAIAYLARALAEPMLRGSLAYSTFLPIVILIAYAFGRWPAIVAAAVCGPLALFSFVEPAFAWKAPPAALWGFVLFLLTCSVAILVITGLTGALRAVSRELGRAQAVADSHAGLFRELNERMSHHMRLVAGVLALQAKGEPEPEVANSLRRAMERSLLISRVHRELGGRADEAVAFGAFAAALARAVCQARNAAPEQVKVEPSEVVLSVEDATSLGVALAECLGTLFDIGVTGSLLVRLGAAGRRAEVAISESVSEAESALVSVANGYLLRAMTEQLGAQVSLRADARGAALVLSVPGAKAAADPIRPAATLH